MRRLLGYIIFIVAMVSCRQSLVDESPQCYDVDVRFDIDWSLSGMSSDDITNISIYAYPSTGGVPYIKLSSNIESTTMTLGVGSYSLLVMSGVVEDVEGVSFSDTYYYSLFSAYSIADTDVSDSYYTPSDDESVVESIEQMAVWRMDEFEITQEMAWCQYCEDHDSEPVVVEIQPTPFTAECVVEVSFDNLDNAQLIECALSGLADGATLATNSRIGGGDEINIYLFDLDDIEYDDDSESGSGVAQAQITTFGKQPDSDATYQLELYIILNSGELVTYTVDVTSQVTISDDLNIFIDLTSDESTISLPESTGTGFGVDDWGDSELVELL